MKVLARIGYEDRYICEVGHTELEKFLNLYYGKLDKLEPGQEVDLGRGYDFCRDTKEAFEKTQSLLNSNEKVVTAILNGIRFLPVETVPAKKGCKSDGN